MLAILVPDLLWGTISKCTRFLLYPCMGDVLKSNRHINITTIDQAGGFAGICTPIRFGQSSLSERDS